MLKHGQDSTFYVSEHKSDPFEGSEFAGEGGAGGLGTESRAEERRVGEQEACRGGTSPTNPDSPCTWQVRSKELGSDKVLS